ncbi:NAD(P)/FAD-dependent oxidoreductase [Aurantiacibacter sediminis]|uniref:FAD-dependent oxidoreductase n=1 Tax=Aurantiacibacter sediminis TaxID=2793064 RepID=A0ABS0N590_9SPHN|nr:FAD-dependent oxidoreductase [Aurantiacibacter sediminis]MBH5322959.1 FAD-dependent oxidoreductase [Aurantiacibacter sediminis]
MDIAIIGAGMAGLSCGAALKEAGHRVSLFDKGRGPGGRMATRRAEVDGKTLRFDHGAQYFTARDPRFAAQVERWQSQGVVAPWSAAKEGAWVGTPGMNAPIKAMAAKQDVTFGKRIEEIRREGKALWLLDEEGTVGSAFDAVLVAVPAEQVAPLLYAHQGEFAQLSEDTVSKPNWTLMATFTSRVDHGDTLHDAGAIGWAARNSAKPDRAGETECWVIQASPEWSEEHLEEEKDDVIDQLLKAFAEQVGTLPGTLHTDAHRWRYARSGASGDKALWDADKKIGVCGDWLIGPRVESAFISGVELADRIIEDG